MWIFCPKQRFHPPVPHFVVLPANFSNKLLAHMTNIQCFILFSSWII
uniref:1 4-dihydroxy-2-naphthoyl-CoA synthase n=1 Tax=Rhizophora mucronata TaxID=61149 RepID=A0A2P2MFE7_RHIMU